MQGNEIKLLFKSNYSKFVKNMLSLTYKIKYTYDLKICKPITDQENNNNSYYIELASNVRDIFNYSSKKIIEGFIYTNSSSNKKESNQTNQKDLNNDVFKLSSSIEETSNICFRNTHLYDEKLEMKFVKNAKNEKETNLEIWYDSVLIISQKVEDFNITRVYYDDVFGKPKFSPDGSKIIFIAECDSSKTFKNYFNIKEDEIKDTNDSNGSNDVNVISTSDTNTNKKNNLVNNLSKFEYKQDFGECLKDKSSPKIFVYDIESNKFFNLNLENFPNIFPACPMFDQTNEDIILCGYEMSDFKYGLIYCLKRKSSIYLIKNPILEEIITTPNKKDVSTEKSEKKINTLINLTSKQNEYTNLYPIFSPNFKHLLWFANENATPHMNGLKLYAIDWDTKKKLDSENIQSYNLISDTCKLLLDKVKGDNDHFNGIYSYEDSISQLNFLDDNLFIFSTQHRNTDCIFIYDINKNRLIKIPSETNSQKIISVRRGINHGLIFSLNSDVNILPHANVISFDYKEYEKEEGFEEVDVNGVRYLKKYNNNSNNIFKSSLITNSNKNLFTSMPPMVGKKTADVIDRSMSEYLNNIMNHISVDDLSINGVNGHFIYLKQNLLQNNNGSTKKPIIYFLHGGPNSAIERMFIGAQLIFLASGYSVLIVNYPGSTGYGQDYLSSLNGRIGTLDVESCGDFLIEFTKMQKYCELVDMNNIMLYGGSHGGFLSCWLIVHEKYCKLFASAVIRNPVTDLVSSMATTDIPDWVLGQTTDLDVCENYPPSKEIYARMYDASPVFLAKNCVTPSLICLGEIDKRVNVFNGLYFYEAIRRNSCETRLLMYPEDGHPLASPETEVDCIFNICDWFQKHLKA